MNNITLFRVSSFIQQSDDGDIIIILSCIFDKDSNFITIKDKSNDRLINIVNPSLEVLVYAIDHADEIKNKNFDFDQYPSEVINEIKLTLS